MKRTLLVSLPWAAYSLPSFQLGCLCSFAQSRGFCVDQKPLHLEIAYQFGFENYDQLSYSYRGIIIGEALCMSLLFKASKQKILRRIEKRLPNASLLGKKLSAAMSKVFQDIPWKEYHLLGMTLNHGQLFSSLLLASFAKRQNPEIVIVLGGAPLYSEMASSFLRNFEQIDYIVTGEGEIAFARMLEQLNEGNISEKSIPGLHYRRGGDIRCNPSQGLDDFSGLPDPDYDEYFRLLESDPVLGQISLSPCLPVEVARGCKYRCAFCCDNVRPLRVRPPEEIAASILRLNTKYMPSSFTLIAPEIPADCAEILFKLLASQKRDYRIFCELRVGAKKELLNLMKSAGVCEVQTGIESFDSKILLKMNKGTQLIDNLQTMKHCEELGIVNSGNLIIDFPTINQSEIRRSAKSIEYAWSFRPLSYSTFTVHNGSDVYLHSSKYGIKRIKNSQFLNGCLSRELSSELRLPYLDYEKKRKGFSCRTLKKTASDWMTAYSQSLLSGQPLLSYTDGGEFLRIEDYRFFRRSIRLDGRVRELYLYCDSKQSLQNIKSTFDDIDELELNKILSYLCKSKLMYNECDFYLSLAIRISNKDRRHLGHLTD